MKNNKLPEWNPAKMAEPTDFMTYEEFVERLKKNLGITDKNWWVYDFQTPHNESEYQNELKLLQKIMHK
ncbi:hypothetical protein [Lactiplantibacillus plantarum]|uniref:hypothetical protein n=1 Tax=Lactiplantibacillus plantarum TaxID=1590 RepID=UPI000FECC34E|nr:hypothetical protein [Lactiplantibacillus plantarum]QAR36886.1 hypothetical protein EQJ27_02515 [Lactiplantibacillus plantarum]RWZ07060.1 hypothetical protein EQG51_02515 [Lactiplantibacillus plantarum]RWZ34899.1 hypothetical protein EQG59_02515 [Lactiplantibacillus plantarum]